jgi:hypothetical protein
MGVLLLRRSRRPESCGLTARIRLGRFISIFTIGREMGVESLEGLI